MREKQVDLSMTSVETEFERWVRGSSKARREWMYTWRDSREFMGGLRSEDDLEREKMVLMFG